MLNFTLEKNLSPNKKKYSNYLIKLHIKQIKAHKGIKWY